MKKHYVPFTQLVWLVLLWAGLVNQITWAQSVPDAQWARIGKTLAITSDGSIATTEHISNPNVIIPGAPGPAGDILVKYSLQGDQLFRTGLIQVGNYIGGQFQGYNYEVLGGLRIAAITNGGLALTGGSSLLGKGYIGNVSATGGVSVGPYDGEVPETMTGTPDGGFLILSSVNKSAYLTKYNINSQREWQKQIMYVAPGSTTPDQGLTRGKSVITTPDGGYLIVGYFNSAGQASPERGWVAKLDGEGNVVWQKLLTDFPFDSNPNPLIATTIITDVAVSADGAGYALVGLGLTFQNIFGTGILELDFNGTIRPGRAKVIDAQQATFPYVTGYTGSGGKKYYAIGYTSLQGRSDPKIQLFDPVLSKGVASRIFQGPGQSSLTNIGTAGDGSLVFVTDNNQLVKLLAETSPPSPPAISLVLTQPTYNCQSGAITFNTTGGDGSPITYNAPGISRSSATSNTGTVEQGLRNDPKPITITATQNGQTVSYTFDFGAFCTGTPPPVNPPTPPVTPPTGGTLALTQPTYNCQTGAIVFNITGGDGSPITYSAPGIMRSSATSNTGTVEQGLRNDPKPITITATQNGHTVSYTFDFKAFCTGTQPPVNPPVNPPTGDALVLLAPTYDCASGALTFRTSGGNGSTIEFMAIGITGWTSNPNQFVDRDSRTANDVKPFTLMARQNGVMVSYVWDLKAACGRSQARLGAGERVSELSVSVLGNPVRDAVTVEIRGAQSQPLTLRLLDMRGRLVESRLVERARAAEQQIFDVAQQGPGLLLLRAISGTQTKTVKILKQ